MKKTTLVISIGLFTLLLCTILYLENNFNLPKENEKINYVVSDEDLNWLSISDVENTFILIFYEGCYDIEQITYLNIEKMAFQNEFVYLKFQSGMRIQLQADTIKTFRLVNSIY